jgi:hypothetical protein
MTSPADQDDPVANGERQPTAWNQTVEDMHAMAEAREDEQNWESIVIEPELTIPDGPESDRSDPYGFVHVVDDSDAETFARAFAECSFPRYEVFRNEVEDSVFFLTELQDTATRTTVLIAGRYDVPDAGPLVDEAIGQDELFTHVEGPDGEIIGSVQHSGYEKFVPEEILDDEDRPALD